ncbi:MAG TPA: hypothetical protein PLW99_00910 [Candidatus Paceibacterota bacterium]|nr:MAG: hypothetical protein B7X03_00490 [Parcubacteria group bacterium 21-58-10]OYV83259.1 MAG: hypothetical protein B7W96_00165 [Parcubacteria group bacterium 37-58-5]HQT82693.1 hypothetical protein [Candidatus Paceibacterota bacterium]
MDIEKQKKNARQATIVCIVFLVVSVYFGVKVLYPDLGNEPAHLFDPLYNLVAFILAAPLTLYYAILAVFRFSKLQGLK